MFQSGPLLSASVIGVDEAVVIVREQVQGWCWKRVCEVEPEGDGPRCTS